MDSAMPAAHQPRLVAKRKNERREYTWNEMVVRFHLPATALVKYLVITTGDTADSGTSCATSQAKKGFSERTRLTIVASAKPLSCLRKVRNLYVIVVRQLLILLHT
jgi:hypothetical protein